MIMSSASRTTFEEGFSSPRRGANITFVGGVFVVSEAAL